MRRPTKDYIFGLLFLKRCSDVYEAEHDTLVGRKFEQGMAQEEAENQYGENPDFYDTFFVPERARRTTGTSTSAATSTTRHPRAPRCGRPFAWRGACGRASRGPRYGPPARRSGSVRPAKGDLPAMEALELIKLIDRGEDSRLQFKRDVTNAESLGAECVALSNGKGGRILIGVDDTGVVAGLSPEDVRRINQLVANSAAQNVRPAVNPVTENVEVGGRRVIVVTVNEGIAKPYMDQSGAIWVKSGSDKRRVTAREELQTLFQSSSLVHADEVPVDGATSADMDRKHLETFFEKRYGEKLRDQELPLEQLLENLNLAKRGVPNLAGLLLFGQNPQRYRPVLVMKAVSFFGDDPAGTAFRDSEDIGGCLRDLYDRTMSFLSRNLRRLQRGANFNQPGEIEVSLIALEELVVNMLLHRDYFISSPWRILMFDSRIELISPGALPNNLTVEHIKHGMSNMRNPILTSFATHELPYRGIGTGILRALAHAPGITFEDDPDRNMFRVTIPRPAVA